MLSIYLGFTAMSSMPSLKDFIPLQHEKPLKEYKKFIGLMSLPNWTRKLAAWLLDTFTGEQRQAKKVRSLMDKNHFEINELFQRMEKWRASFDQKW
jgi:fatty acid amide hydrolase